MKLQALISCTQSISASKVKPVTYLRAADTCIRQPDAHIEALDKQAEVAPHVQDDFDIAEEDLKTLEPRHQDENQVLHLCKLSHCQNAWL